MVLQDVVPARIVLLVTLCLVLINMFNFTTWVPHSTAGDYNIILEEIIS